MLGKHLVNADRRPLRLPLDQVDEYLGQPRDAPVLGALEEDVEGQVRFERPPAEFVIPGRL